jgi:hypothetical protein
MDPITLILTGLATGAALVAKGTLTAASQGAYDTLKARIQHKFAGYPVAETVLAQYSQKPKVWEAPLKDALAETGADKDQEIIQAASRFMALANSPQATRGKFNTQITGDIHGFVMGDHATVTMAFGGKR